MIIKAGTKLTVKDRRKGTFEGVAAKDFDTEMTEFYPIITSEYVEGAANEWYPGDKIECRNTLCKIQPHD